MKPISPEGYHLFHNTLLALARAERAGITCDVDYCNKMIKHIDRQVKHIDKKLSDSEMYHIGRELYGKDFSMTDDQLRIVLFENMGLSTAWKTATGKPSMSADALETLSDDVPEISLMLRKRKLEKASGTYLSGFLKEQVNGVIHSNFNLHIARSFRPSTDSPNLSNVPVRDPEIKGIVRKAIKARKGHKLLCGDFKGIEVAVGCPYHNDPTMKTYVTDKSTDMHRDMASECYIIPETDVTKAIRHTTKGAWVFAQFYGDWYKSCAEGLWSIVHTEKLTNGTLLIDHLKTLKTYSLQDFEDHLKKVEDKFWGERFRVYAKWKQDWFKAYEKKGYFDTLTGFRCQGIMNEKQTSNYPIQGSAFHIMAQCIVWLDHDSYKEGWDSRICNQIYDDLMIDTHPKEERMVEERMKMYMTERVPEHFKWMNVPVELDIEKTPVDGTWYDKE